MTMSELRRLEELRDEAIENWRFFISDRCISDAEVQQENAKLKEFVDLTDKSLVEIVETREALALIDPNQPSPYSQ